MKVRPPAVAGMFYPAVPEKLRDAISGMLASAAVDGDLPKALVLPHAGYMYSGQMAARGYRLLQDKGQALRRIVLLGPAHRVPLRGVALPGADELATPLGNIPVDRDARERLVTLDNVIESEQAHAEEHSIEVHLPFLQVALASEISVVPLVVGHAAASEIRELLQLLWGADETLVIISSDLSHFHPDAEAREIDAATIERILACDPGIGVEQACGAFPLNGMLELARQRHMQVRELGRCNSSDFGGPRERVVGYTSLAFHDA